MRHASKIPMDVVFSADIRDAGGYRITGHFYFPGIQTFLVLHTRKVSFPKCPVARSYLSTPFVHPERKYDEDANPANRSAACRDERI